MEEDKINTLFNEISEKLKNNPPNNITLNNNQKLKFYGLYKVATIGKINDSNRPKPGLFDFQTKYKNEAWEKCSIYSQIEAKIEYIKYYSEIYNEKIELNIKPNPKLNKIEFDFPEDLNNNSIYSSNAKSTKKEKDEYLKSASTETKLIQKLKDDIYAGDIFTEEILTDYEKENNINCILIYNIYIVLTMRDNLGQSLLHIGVDAMNFSVIDSLYKKDYIKQLINVTDDLNMTPMHIAAINFDIHIFDLLYNMKPDLTIKDKDNKTCIDYLKENEDVEVPKKYLI